MRISYWSSDVCSSDLAVETTFVAEPITLVTTARSAPPSIKTHVVEISLNIAPSLTKTAAPGARVQPCSNLFRAESQRNLKSPRLRELIHRPFHKIGRAHV